MYECQRISSAIYHSWPSPPFRCGRLPCEYERCSGVWQCTSPPTSMCLILWKCEKFFKKGIKLWIECSSILSWQIPELSTVATAIIGMLLHAGGAPIIGGPRRLQGFMGQVFLRGCFNKHPIFHNGNLFTKLTTRIFENSKTQVLLTFWIWQRGLSVALFSQSFMQPRPFPSHSLPYGVATAVSVGMNEYNLGVKVVWIC